MTLFPSLCIDFVILLWVFSVRGQNSSSNCNYVFQKSTFMATDTCVNVYSLSGDTSYQYACNSSANTLSRKLYSGLNCQSSNLVQSTLYNQNSTKINFKCSGNNQCHGMYTAYSMTSTTSCQYDPNDYNNVPVAIGVCGTNGTTSMRYKCYHNVNNTAIMKQEYFKNNADCIGAPNSYIIYYNGCFHNYNDTNATGSSTKGIPWNKIGSTFPRIYGTYYKYSVLCHLNATTTTTTTASSEKKKVTLFAIVFKCVIAYFIICIGVLLHCEILLCSIQYKKKRKK